MRGAMSAVLFVVIISPAAGQAGVRQCPTFADGGIACVRELVAVTDFAVVLFFHPGDERKARLTFEGAVDTAIAAVVPEVPRAWLDSPGLFWHARACTTYVPRG